MEKLQALPGVALVGLDKALSSIQRASECTTIDDFKPLLAQAVQEINTVLEQAIGAAVEQHHS